MEAFVILSDIHANLTALRAVLAHAAAHYRDYSVIILGDIINYGMRPNETVEEIRRLTVPIKVLLSGNHESALFGGDTSRFSTDRGRAVLGVTRRLLSEESCAFLRREQHCRPSCEFTTEGGKKVLAVHGSCDDPLWGTVKSATVRRELYAGYDYVLSGHSHVPHLMEEFFDADAPELRNRHRTAFINPGSVGQPRNQNPAAQYAYWEPETETLHFNSVPYDIECEQALYIPEIDPFYSRRLERGI